MPSLIKLELLADNESLAYVVMMPTGAVAFRFADARVLTLDRPNVFPPPRVVLEDMLTNELGALVVGTDLDERASPELFHVLRETFGLRLPRTVVRARVDQRGPLAVATLRARFLEPWLGSGDVDRPVLGEEPLGIAAYVHARRHSNGVWSQTRINRDEASWTIESGQPLGHCRQQATNGSFFDAQRAADALSHPGGCAGLACGDWMPRLKNEDEWRRLGLL